jgi:hypothetical protein
MSTLHSRTFMLSLPYPSRHSLTFHVFFSLDNFTLPTFPNFTLPYLTLPSRTLPGRTPLYECVHYTRSPVCQHALHYYFVFLILVLLNATVRRTPLYECVTENASIRMRALHLLTSYALLTLPYLTLPGRTPLRSPVCQHALHSFFVFLISLFIHANPGRTPLYECVHYTHSLLMPY